ncbi:unnamed protein product [Tilletia controversa]|uniref:Ornithine decarboxylase antizyme n=3 Tax=Tilletia TaxID=13289 RepID=A0A8X7SYH1_9BASI|nr:hypothetical protein CF336_g2687 [Tilletia laevis]KAE8200204.1 hypothetical protein CF328_g3028 [Tilletia controversa]KAE8262329.1 hypothetical protein A4X03_0g2546 [Tilletia caries]KAE8205050.1 hypothetical protein CF335_g2449 [Tilletia laevis]KAE8252196.1 hypothetical protein A4X06_0g2364 [Tilletia controversa]
MPSEDSLATPPPPASTATAPLPPALPLPRGAFDNSRPQPVPSASAVGEQGAARASRSPLRVEVSETSAFASFGPSVTEETLPIAATKGDSSSAAEFLATCVFDVPSFSSLSLDDDPLSPSSRDRGPSAHASSAVLGTLAPRCEAVDVHELAAGWRGAVLTGPVPSVAGGVSSGSLGSVGSPSRSLSAGMTPTSPVGMPGLRRAAQEQDGYLDSPAAGEGGEEGEQHRTLYVTLPGPAPLPAPTSALSPVEDEKGDSDDVLNEKISPLERPAPVRRISRLSSSAAAATASSAVAATLRHAVLNILDLASETLDCTTVVFVLERDRADLADLLHGLCYVGGQVLHVKGRPRRGFGGGGGGSAARGIVGSPGGRSMGSGMGRAGSGSHRGSYGSMGSITAQFPGSVVMPVRITAAGAGSGSSGSVLGDDDLLLLPRADVILVAVAL